MFVVLLSPFYKMGVVSLVLDLFRELTVGNVGVCSELASCDESFSYRFGARAQFVWTSETSQCRVTGSGLV